MSFPKHLNVAPQSLRKNPWNSNSLSPDAMEKLKASIQRLGMFKDVIVRQLSNGELEILGGQHRVEAALELGWSFVPVSNRGSVSDEVAKEMGLVDNARYGTDDTLKLAEIFKGLDAAALPEFMPYTDAEIATIFTASSIALDDLSLPDPSELDQATAAAGSAAQSHVVMRFKIPANDAQDVTAFFEKIMKAQKFKDEDSLSNVGNALIWFIRNGSLA